MKNYASLWASLLAVALISCNTARKQAEDIQIEFGTKPTIIYKTTEDYSAFVPVMLSEDKRSIVAYPGPADVYYKDTLAYPTPLADGYWLDHRGINNRVAFLDITYEEYAKMSQKLLPEQLVKHIQDKAPLVACYDCGSVKEIDQLNILIKGKALSKCRNLME